MPSLTKKLAILAMIGAGFCTVPAQAHTVSIGYENAGTPGSVSFWFGTYHVNPNYTEGSMHLTNTTGYNNTVAFSLYTTTKPAGLVDGTTNFYSNGSHLGTVNAYSTPVSWQGVTISGLSAGTYTFTYIPISSPTAVWAPIDSVILSSTVTLSAAVVGSNFVDNSNNQSHGAASVLDDITGSATGDMGAAISTLQGLSNEDQAKALQHISPEAGAAASQSSSQSVNGALDSVQVRLNNIRSEGYGSQLMSDLTRGAKILVASNDGDMANLFSSSSDDNSFWVKVFGSHGTQKAADGFSGYNDTTGGVTLGADTLLSHGWIAGAAFTYANTRVQMDDLRSGDSSKISSYQLTGYSSRNFGDWYVEGMLAYARQTFDTSRNTTVSGIAEGSFSGNQYAARVTAGMPFDLDDGFTLTPIGGIEVNYLDQEGYTETGAGALNLHNAGVSATRVRSMIGPRLSYDTMYEDYKLQPSLQLTWRHEFINGGIAYSSTFAGGGAAFTTPGQIPASNTVDIGAAINVTNSDNVTFSVQLDTERAERYSAYSGQLLVQWGF